MVKTLLIIFWIMHITPLNASFIQHENWTKIFVATGLRTACSLLESPLELIRVNASTQATPLSTLTQNIYQTDGLRGFFRGAPFHMARTIGWIPRYYMLETIPRIFQEKGEISAKHPLSLLSTALCLVGTDFILQKPLDRLRTVWMTSEKNKINTLPLNLNFLFTASWPMLCHTLWGWCSFLSMDPVLMGVYSPSLYKQVTEKQSYYMMHTAFIGIMCTILTTPTSMVLANAQMLTPLYAKGIIPSILLLYQQHGLRFFGRACLINSITYVPSTMLTLGIKARVDHWWSQEHAYFSTL